MNAALPGFPTEAIHVKDEAKLILWSPKQNSIRNLFPGISIPYSLKIIDLIIDCPDRCLHNDHHERNFKRFQMCASQLRTNEILTEVISIFVSI